MISGFDVIFDGKLSVENRFDFLNLITCRFIWQQVKFPSVTDASNTTTRILKQGEVQGSDVAANGVGVVDIKTSILPEADALFLTVID